MDNFFVPAIIVLVFAIVVALAIAGNLQEKRRREALRALAARLGLRFSANKNRPLVKQFAFLNLLQQGGGRYAYNVIEGEYKGHPICCFDYHYTTTSTDSKGRTQTHHHYCSMMILRLEQDFPELRIYPETFLSRIGQMLGFSNIDFESVEFSKAFTVRAKDRKFAYDICHPRMMEYLLNHRDLSLEIEQDCLARPSERLLVPEKLEAGLDMLCDLRALFPQYLFAR